MAAQSGASEIIFISLDVIFPEIISRLYFYEHEIRLAYVLYAVQVPPRYINSLPGPDAYLVPVVREHALTLDDEPVLGPSLVALQAQPLAGIYRDPFYFMIIRIYKVFVKAPGAMRIVIIQPAYS
jgi:hypothetical protein